MTKRVELLNLTDPDRIYVENIRSIFNLPTKVAKFLCEMAVRSGEFEKMYGIKCPNCGRTIKVSNDKKGLPEQFTCRVCEALEEGPSDFNTSDAMIFTFYRLKR